MQTDIQQRAKALATFMKENRGIDLDYSKSMLKESAMILFEQKNCKISGQFSAISYADFIVEIMSILTDPDFSSRLDTNSKKYGGEMLKRMYDFFYSNNLTDVESYADYLRLSHFSGTMTEKELEDLEFQYKNRDAA